MARAGEAEHDIGGRQEERSRRRAPHGWGSPSSEFGHLLDEEFLKPLGITQTRLAADVGVPVQRINLLVRGKRGVTPNTALRLARYLRTSPEVWLNLLLLPLGATRSASAHW
jgi:addiction module HigA family antidote